MSEEPEKLKQLQNDSVESFFKVTNLSLSVINKLHLFYTSHLPLVNTDASQDKSKVAQIKLLYHSVKSITIFRGPCNDIKMFQSQI